MPISMSHEIDIDCTPEQVYNYVTQPWRWREWHPDSRGAHAAKEVLMAGDEFDETIAVKPLAPLPITLVRHPHYVVREAVPSSRWAVEGQFSDGWVSFKYEIEPRGQGARFKRTLEFEVRGVMRFLVPLVTRKQRGKSLVALAALKRRLEEGSTAG
jgi:hypothetical protein